MNNNITIALYDSGIGGLSLLKKCVESFNNVNFIYLGDNLNAPYGNKSEEELYNLAEKNVKTLLNYGANVIVFACNTLSTIVLEKFKENEFGVCFVGVVPPAINEDVALLCTGVTARSNYVKNNFKKATVIPLPFLAGEIERFIFTPEKINFKADVSAINDSVKTVVLGCTHYSLFKSEFEKLLKKVNVIDGLSNAVNDIKTAISNLKNSKNAKVKVTYDHQTLKATKRLIVNQNKVFFIGESAFYNKKVFKYILK